MTATVTTAFWSVTINNPSEAQLAIVRNGYPDYCREIVHTLEQGEQGTPHVQAYVKLQRQQRLSFMKKLFPGGHCKPLTSAEYVHNTKMYAQKNDDTTRSAHVHVFQDPTGTIESVMKDVMLAIKKEMDYDFYSKKRLYDLRELIELRMVEKDYKLAKLFVSSNYKAMWKEFGPAMYYSVTHTHTHTQPELFSQQVNIPVTDGSDSASVTSHGSSQSRRSSCGPYPPEEDGDSSSSDVD